MDACPSGKQPEISWRVHNAAVIEAGGGVHQHGARDHHVLDPYPPGALCDGAPGVRFMPWLSRSPGGRRRADSADHQMARPGPDTPSAIHGSLRRRPWQVPPDEDPGEDGDPALSDAGLPGRAGRRGGQRRRRTGTERWSSGPVSATSFPRAGGAGSWAPGRRPVPPTPWAAVGRSACGPARRCARAGGAPYMSKAAAQAADALVIFGITGTWPAR